MWWRRRSKKPGNTKLLENALKVGSQAHSYDRAMKEAMKERALEHSKGQQELQRKYSPQTKGRQPKQLASVPSQAIFEREMGNRIQQLKKPKQLPSVPPQAIFDEGQMRNRIEKLKSGMPKNEKPKNVYLTLEAWRAGECVDSAGWKNACVCEFLQELLGSCQITAKRERCTNVAKIFERKVVAEQADINKLYEWAQSFKTTNLADMQCLK